MNLEVARHSARRRRDGPTAADAPRRARRKNTITSTITVRVPTQSIGLLGQHSASALSVMGAPDRERHDATTASPASRRRGWRKPSSCSQRPGQRRVQVEGQGCACSRMRPNAFRHIVAAISLYRPEPGHPSSSGACTEEGRFKRGAGPIWRDLRHHRLQADHPDSRAVCWLRPELIWCAPSVRKGRKEKLAAHRRLKKNDIPQRDVDHLCEDIDFAHGFNKATPPTLSSPYRPPTSGPHYSRPRTRRPEGRPGDRNPIQMPAHGYRRPADVNYSGLDCIGALPDTPSSPFIRRPNLASRAQKRRYPLRHGRVRTSA